MNLKQSVLAVGACGILIGISGLVDPIVMDNKSEATSQPVQSAVVPTVPSPVQPVAADAEMWFQELVTAFSAEGGISLHQASILADIAATTGSTVQQQQSFKRLVREFAHANGGISLNEMSAIAGIVANDPLETTDRIHRPNEMRPSNVSTIASYGQPMSSSSAAINAPSRRAINDEPSRSSAPNRLGSNGGFRSAETVVLNPAGPNGFSGSNGDFYTRAGPNGVVNTRTGEFMPTN